MEQTAANEMGRVEALFQGRSSTNWEGPSLNTALPYFSISLLLRETAMAPLWTRAIICP